MDSINTTQEYCECSRFTKQSFNKIPHIHRYNKENPTIGNVRWVLLPPSKVEIGRVCEARNISCCYFHLRLLVKFPIFCFNFKSRKRRVTFLDNLEENAIFKLFFFFICLETKCNEFVIIMCNFYFRV